MVKTYGTLEAAKLIGVSRITLHRWLKAKKIRPQAIPLGAGRILWRWTDRDIARAKRVKAEQRPGPKPKGGAK